MADESLAERIAALKDIVPPNQRKFLANTVSSATSWLSSGLKLSGQTLWVVSTSALLLGVPWALAFAEEQQLAEMEREMKMQQSASEVSIYRAYGRSRHIVCQQLIEDTAPHTRPAAPARRKPCLVGDGSL